MSEPLRCDGCVFWERLDKGCLYSHYEDLIGEDDLVMLGRCRRLPPVFDGLKYQELAADTKRRNHTGNDCQLNENTAMATEFPHTFRDQWCGEYKPSANR